VENPPSARQEIAELDKVSLRDALGLLASKRFQGLLLAGSALALFTISDGFLYLAIQRHLDFDERFLPLLFVGSALVYMLLAIPVGRVADRLGRGRVFVGGYLLLLPVYASLLVPAVGIAALPFYLLLVGCYYAATDGVLMALASALLPENLRGSGLALLVTATSLGRLLASVILGAIWTWAGFEAAVLSFGIGLILAMSLAGIVFVRIKEDAAYA
jgi:MFS family permease